MNNNGVITAPVTTTDVSTVLQTSSHDVGTLCRHDSINMWSRFKPVTIPNPAPDRDTEWWKASDGSCNIILPEVKNIYSQVVDTITEDGTNGYSYRKVGGSATAPYRLADFDKYDHYASPPIARVVVPEKVLRDHDLTATCLIPVPDIDTTLPGSLLLEDISCNGGKTLGDLYFGFMIFDSSNTLRGRVTSDTVGSKTATFDLNDSFQPGTYTVYCFLSSVPLLQNATDTAGFFYAVPYCAPAQVEITDEQEVQIALTARYIVLTAGDSPNKDKVSINFTLNVTTDFPQQVNNNVIRMRFSENDPNDVMEQGEKTLDLEDFYLNATDPYTYSGVFSIDVGYRQKNFYLYVSLAGGLYTRSFVPLLPAT